MESQAQAPLVSIIVLTYNGAPWLDTCLAAIQAQTFQDYEVILTDSGSTDGSVEAAEKKYARWLTRVERLECNLGFSVANNRAARLARGQWLIFLNNDAYPDPNWLSSLIAVSEAHPDFQFFASRLLQANDLAHLDGAGDVYHVGGLAWRRFYNQPSTQFGLTSGEVFSPCGAAAMYARELFLEAGGFDEDFFTYMEDLDLGFRLRLRGARCFYVAEAVVRHVGSATIGIRSNFAVYYGHRNMVWVYAKDMPSTLYWRYLPEHLLANFIPIVYFTLRGRGRAIWRAKIDAVRGLGLMLHKRREIQKTRRADPSELAHLMDHRWLSPYRRNKR